MTLWMDKKVAQACPYPGCDLPPSDESVLCETHRRRNNERQKRHYRVAKLKRDRRWRHLLWRAAQLKLL